MEQNLVISVISGLHLLAKLLICILEVFLAELPEILLLFRTIIDVF